MEKSHSLNLPAPLLGAILTNLPDPVLVINAQDHIIMANAKAEDFFKASAAQLAKLGWASLLAQIPTLAELPMRVRDQHASITMRDIGLNHPKFGNYKLDINANLFEYDAEKLVILSLHPAGLASKLDDALHQRGNLERLGALTAMLAHEVKNPLSGIRGAAQLIEGILPQQERRWPSMILAETDRVTRLLESLETLGDSPLLSRKPINIHAVLDRVWQVASAGFANHVTIKRNYDPSLPMVYGDFDQLVQVFMNLVKNAAEAAPQEQGEIGLSTAFVGGIHLQLSMNQKALALPLMVTISDNGKGIDPAIKHRLFEPFISTKQSTKKQGRGIGLALAAKLIGDHNGVIEVDSIPNKTEFKILLPII